MRACLVSAVSWSLVMKVRIASESRFAVVRAAERVDALDLDLDFVMGSSEVMRRHPPHTSPRAGKTPAGKPGSGISHFKSS